MSDAATPTSSGVDSPESPLAKGESVAGGRTRRSGARLPDVPTLTRHRRRQTSVAAILNRTFGRLAECRPELWERRAYLMLMGTVYERLASGPEDIGTDELIALAKALAENRRVEARVRDEQTESASDGVEPGEPKPIAESVRELYGTNFHDPQDGASP